MREARKIDKQFLSVGTVRLQSFPGVLLLSCLLVMVFVLPELVLVQAQSGDFLAGSSSPQAKLRA